MLGAARHEWSGSMSHRSPPHCPLCSATARYPSRAAPARARHSRPVLSARAGSDSLSFRTCVAMD
eukprot:2204896-Prymnesium_polylepis.1